MYLAKERQEQVAPWRSDKEHIYIRLATCHDGIATPEKQSQCDWNCDKIKRLRLEVSQERWTSKLELHDACSHVTNCRA